MSDTLSYAENMAIHFHKQAVIARGQQFGASISDIGSETIVLELVTWPRRVEALLRMLKPFKFIESARSNILNH